MFHLEKPSIWLTEGFEIFQTQAIYKIEIGYLCAKDALMCPSISLSPSAHPALSPVVFFTPFLPWVW